MRPSKAALWKAVRSFCLECLGGSILEVERCSALNCQLHPFRFGNLSRLYRSARKPPRTAFKNQSGHDSERISRPGNASLDGRKGVEMGKTIGTQKEGKKLHKKAKIAAKGQRPVSRGSTDRPGNDGIIEKAHGSDLLHGSKIFKPDSSTKVPRERSDSQRLLFNKM